MSLSNSRLAYDDCFKLLDAALDEPRGIRVEVASSNDATYLRMRIHHARTIDRRENAATYIEKDHPLHGRSPYDILVVRIEDDHEGSWLYLDKQKVEIGRVESIPETKTLMGPEPMLQIEGPKAEPEQYGLQVDTPPLPVIGIRRR